uniref:Peptidase S1 domain-containing protein n=1 Tax=Megaselia scalaris TaxID=36166 RepID=T1GE17_MEGSC
MFRLSLILSAVIAIASASVLPHFVQVPKLDGRIVGGQPTTIEQYPYQVSLFRVGGSHFCGGSLVSNNIVITAAHCLQSISASQLQVRLGSTSRSSAQDVEFTNSIQPIGLASVDPAPGTTAVVTGWGTVKEGGFTLPTTLQEVFVDIVSRQSCQSAYGKNYDINASMVCAASEGKDACQGDSGGPLVANGQLVGVVSWGIGCARSAYPGVYGNVPDLLSWVQANADI